MKRTKRRILSLLLSLVILVTLFTSYAYAETFGGKWASNPTYYLSSSHIYYQEFLSAVNAWNSKLASTGTSIRIKSSSATSATIGPNFEYYGDTGWVGYGRPGPDPYSGTYLYADLKFNRTELDWLSDPEATGVAIHELGHVLGIAHTVSSPNPSVMRQGNIDDGILTIQTFDYNTLNSIY
ncbi:MAG TPA: hypothetical protein VEF53_06805 [Patescibacteria group bacterium]|jgi:predicted Zn-dependent protease|nr:hypothetical protein [Patescibacteria group bacterium]